MTIRPLVSPVADIALPLMSFTFLPVTLTESPLARPEVVSTTEPPLNGPVAPSWKKPAPSVWAYFW